MTFAELTIFLAVIIVVAALFASIFVVIWRRGAAPTPDHVPIRLGVILLGAIGLTCIGGLFYLSNTPDLSKGSDQSSGTAQTPGETGLLQAQAQQGVTESVVNSTNEVVKNASTDASTLGVSNQIVGLLGTIAGASVAGIAGLLVGPGKTEQPPPSDGAGTGGGGTSPPTSPADLLREWAKLRDEGVITDGDFNRMKERLLLEEEQKTSSVKPRDQAADVDTERQGGPLVEGEPQLGGPSAGVDSVPGRRQCGALEAHYLLVEHDPTIRERLSELEEATERRMMALGPEAIAREEPITIPVVVHVVYNDESENISEDQIESQITVLNQDFAATNPNTSNVPSVWQGFIGDTNIRFALADITRTQTDHSEFGIDNSVKSAETGGVDPSDPDRYLNMWVCTLAGGQLGYAQFPGGPSETDGVVILNTAFGTTGTAEAPFNGGKQATHEIGHWLNLRHIWGDEPGCDTDDGCTDTPPQADPNFGRPTFPHVSCNNGPYGDMFMNFMDLTDDACMSMFTPQQVVRMLATLEGPRSTLGQGNGG